MAPRRSSGVCARPLPAAPADLPSALVPERGIALPLLPAEGSPAPESPADGRDEPLDVDGKPGAPLLGAGEGIEGTGELPVLGNGLPLAPPEGLGTDGAPPPPE